MMKLTKWQWVFAAFLAVLTIASIVAEFAGHHETAGTAEVGEHIQKHENEHNQEHGETSETGHGEAQGHASHWWSGIPLFWIWFGIIGCGVLILFAKKILGPLVYKKEDYYDE
jgi:hypothetical protein